MKEHTKRDASVTARIPKELKDALEAKAKAEGISMSDAMNKALRAYCKL